MNFFVQDVHVKNDFGKDHLKEIYLAKYCKQWKCVQKVIFSNLGALWFLFQLCQQCASVQVHTASSCKNTVLCCRTDLKRKTQQYQLDKLSWIRYNANQVSYQDYVTHCFCRYCFVHFITFYLVDIQEYSLQSGISDMPQHIFPPKISLK